MGRAEGGRKSGSGSRARMGRTEGGRKSGSGSRARMGQAESGRMSGTWPGKVREVLGKTREEEIAGAGKVPGRSIRALEAG
jgi:hypothetical protein